MGQPENPAPTAPSVFISWAHRDSLMSDRGARDWENLVLALAERLIAAGCDVQLDLYQRPPVDWSRWGPQKIDTSDFTLMVPNRAYRQRWDGSNPPGEGAGAAREVNTLKGMFDKNQDDFYRRALVVMLPGITGADVPDEIYACVQRFTLDPSARSSRSLAPLRPRLA
jgi:hypothetical protein